jgi:hypothetical protein
MNPNIFNFISFRNISDIVYSYLDGKTIKNLGSSCREINLIYRENQKYLNLAKKLIADYDIHTSYPLNRPIWYALRVNQFFLIGEDHTKPEHRQIFANFVNAIWLKNKFALLIEMPSNTINTSLDKGATKYLNKEIAETCKGWDSNSKERINVFAISDAKIFLLLSLLLQVQDEINEERSLKILEDLIFNIKKFLHEGSKWNEITDIYLLQLQDLLKIMTSDPTDKFFCNYKYKKAYVMLDLTIKVQSISYKCIRDIDEMLIEQAKERDDSMLACLEYEKKLGNRVILIGGLAHLQEESKKYKIIKILKRKKESFLALHPKSEGEQKPNPISETYQELIIPKMTSREENY